MTPSWLSGLENRIYDGHYRKVNDSTISTTQVALLCAWITVYSLLTLKKTSITKKKENKRNEKHNRLDASR